MTVQYITVLSSPHRARRVAPATEGTTMQTASPVALVTGASSGIGRAAARALVDAGFAVVGTSRTAANAGPLAGVTFLDLDVASDESVRSLVKEVIERFGRIDVLVNNAGVGAVGAGEESSINQAKRSSTSTSSA